MVALTSGSAALLVAPPGIINVAGAVAIPLLTTTDKKLFSVAVYPTLANDVLNKFAFKAKNNVDVVTGYEAYSTATITVFCSLVLIHWFTLLILSLADGTTMKNPFCCSLESPFGMIDVLIEMKTVLFLLLNADWVIVISLRFETLKIQSAPL